MASPGPPKAPTHYEPQDALKEATNGLLVGGFMGLFAAAVKTSLTRYNVGAMAVFTRNGHLIGVFAGPLAAYSLTSSFSANLREKKDTYNEALGGFFAGGILGLYKRNLRSVLGLGALTAITLATVDYGGGMLKRPDEKHADVDPVALREYWRKNRRRPIEETISEIGEGRGIKPPGYEERRRERLKERYGLEVQPTLNNQKP